MRLRAMLGYLPQDFGVYPRVSAEGLLDHIAVLKGIGPAKARREEVEALLQQTNLFDARKRAVASFSGGMRQRFGIAQALLGNPQLIIVDEPTAGLDPAERVRFHDLLSRIGEHAVVILSTHILEDVAELCKRMAIIVGGRVVVEGSPSSLVAQLTRPAVAEGGRPRRGRGAAPAVQRDLDPLSRRAYSRIRVSATIGPAPNSRRPAGIWRTSISRPSRTARRPQPDVLRPQRLRWRAAWWVALRCSSCVTSCAVPSP